MGMLREFKDFALKGNVIDLAVAVIVGGAFGTIISSLVDDVITPLLLTPALKAAKEDTMNQGERFNKIATTDSRLIPSEWK